MTLLRGLQQEEQQAEIREPMIAVAAAECHHWDPKLVQTAKNPLVVVVEAERESPYSDEKVDVQNPLEES